MRYRRTTAFARLYRRLSQERRGAVDRAMTLLDAAFQSGRPVGGLGLKALRHGLWEIRCGLLDRVVFARTGDVAEFLVVGTHDEIRRFLKRL